MQWLKHMHVHIILIAELTQKDSLVPSQYSVISNENIATPLVKKGIVELLKLKVSLTKIFLPQS